MNNYTNLKLRMARIAVWIPWCDPVDETPQRATKAPCVHIAPSGSSPDATVGIECFASVDRIAASQVLLTCPPYRGHTI